MLRNVWAVSAGIVLSVLLMALAGAVELRFTDAGAAALTLAEKGRGAHLAQETPDRVFEFLRQSRLRNRALYRPLIAAAVALLVALLGRGWPRSMSTLALIPFLVMTGQQESWGWACVALCGLYLALALAVATATGRLKARLVHRAQA